jgi:hypothetical protein
MWMFVVVVTNPAGNVIPAIRSTRGTATRVVDRNRRVGLDVGTTTITPHWYGDPLDLGHITTALWCAEQGDPT